MATALGIPTAARIVHQNSPDDLRAEGEKVDAVLATNPTRSKKLKKSFIGQSGRLKRMAGGAAPQVPPRDSAEFRIYGRHHLAKCLFIAIVPGEEQLTD